MVSFFRSRRSPSFVEIARMSRMFEIDINDAPDLQFECKTAFNARLFAIMSMGYEAELHSQARRARRRRSVPERCPAPQFSQSGGGTRGDAICDEPSSTRTRGTCRRGTFPPHHAQCRPERSGRT